MNDSTTGNQRHDNLLRTRLQDRDAVIAVVGLGYVGLPLVHAIHATGFRVLGYDTDEEKIEKLEAGTPYIHHLGCALFSCLSTSDRFIPTNDARRLEEADVIILCVPTPLGDSHEPDLSYVFQSSLMVAGILRPGHLVILQSTTYPGTTRNEMLPLLEESGLSCGSEFFLAYSPEREEPGRMEPRTEDIPRVVGGVDEQSTDLALFFYGTFINDVLAVDSAEIAEASKLLENIYRAVNIALVNELKTVFNALDIDIWKVIEAASTKPFGYHPFYPGPGIGGHCIPIDPFYLAWIAGKNGQEAAFIELAGRINTTMPSRVVETTFNALAAQGAEPGSARVLVIGITYKPGIDDCRESPAAEIITLLQDRGCTVSYHDPHMAVFPPMRKYRIALSSVPLDAEVVSTADAVLVVTDHAQVDWQLIADEASLVVDTRNAMHVIPRPKALVIKA